MKNGLEDYVRLAISDYHPMANLAEKQGRVEELIWLTINDRVFRFHSLFTDMNATANDVTINDDPRTAFESESNQAEVLIRGFVAARWIRFPPYDGACGSQTGLCS